MSKSRLMSLLALVAALLMAVVNFLKTGTIDWVNLGTLFTTALAAFNGRIQGAPSDGQ